MDFGQRLITARREKGISQEALAEALGVSRQAVSKWETGESKPDVSNLIALCNTLDLNLEYLCFGTETPAEEKTVKKVYPFWAKILLVTAGIVLSILLGMLFGGIVTSTYVYTDEFSQEQMIDIQNVTVVNASATYNWDAGCYEISVTPSIIHEAVQMMLRIENLTNPSAKPITAYCRLEDAVYKWNFTNPENGIQYRITAVFLCDNTQKQVPIMKFHADDGSCGYEHLWGNN